jgi:hypothetical protein
MPRGSYRLNAETVGILSENQRRVAVTIPYNAVVTVVNNPFDCHRLMDVMWEGKVVTIFVEDLHERGELMKVKVAAG